MIKSRAPFESPAARKLEELLLFIRKEKNVALISFVSLGADEMETRKTTALTTVITGLKKFTNYSLQVLAYTKVGDGVFTLPIHCQTGEDGKSR